MLPQFTEPVPSSTIRRALKAAGVCKISHFLSPSIVDELAAITDRCYQAITACGAEDIDTALANHFARWGGINHEKLSPFLAARAVELAAQWEDFQATLGRRIGDLLGSGWRPCPTVSWFRRSNGHANPVPWHIDADAATSLVYGPCGVNLWIPLTSVGTLAPSLEFVLGSHRKMRQLPRLAGTDCYRSEAWIAENAGAPTWIPQLEAGDALLFDHFTLHRTQAIEASKSRTTCEFRFVMTPPIYVRAATRAAHWLRRAGAR